MTEASDSFACFGGTCTVHVGGEGAHGAVAAVRRSLLAWHDRFTRFDAESELSHLNADPREVVPVSPIMARFAASAAFAAELTDGLVDVTLLDELERAGYRGDLGAPLDLPTALGLAPSRRPANGRRPPTWLDGNGRPAHHLLDPGTGRPAFTGVVQATAVAPTALEAEVRAKAAVLSGPDGASAWLPHGGVIVLDDGTHHTQGFPPCSDALSSSASCWSSS